MRIITIILSAIFCLAVPNKTASKNNIQNRSENPQIVKITRVIANLQPNMNRYQNRMLAKVIHENSTRTGIDWRLVVAILFQESSLRLDPQNCKVNFTRCNDMGIGQVRYSVWGKTLKIDKKRMVTDVEYAIEQVYAVLSHYKLQYGKRELNWFTRYHSGDPEFRAIYMRKLNRAYAKINAIKD